MPIRAGGPGRRTSNPVSASRSAPKYTKVVAVGSNVTARVDLPRSPRRLALTSIECFTTEQAHQKADE
jgi:hypothetical protein